MSAFVVGEHVKKKFTYTRWLNSNIAFSGHGDVTLIARAG
jgi:hypothetical protein